MERHDPSEVQPGDTVTIETGTLGKPGHEAFTFEIVESLGKEMKGYEVTVGYVRRITESDAGFRITRITRPAPTIPTALGERFWARWRSRDPREYIVTEGDRIVDLTDGGSWERDLFEHRHSVVPAPEPETVPVPADLIREAERWNALLMQSGDVRVGILTRIVQAVREREGES